MIFLEGLKEEKNINESLIGVLKFIDQEMTKEKIEEFYERKFKSKGSKCLYRIGFASLNPVKLHLESVKDWNNLSSELLCNKQYFSPLFISTNITNGQYRKIIGEGAQYLYKNNNSGSFSDYFVTRKVFENVYKGLRKNGGTFKPEIDTTKVEKGSIKYEILEGFYGILEELVSSKLVAGTGEGMEVFIDFNSIIENINIASQEKVEFVSSLLKETNLDLEVNVDEIIQTGDLNGILYLLESIFFQVEEISGIKIKEEEVASIKELFEIKVRLPFEVPTGEKPTLANPRNLTLGKKTELPTISVLELLLTRMLVTVINKQGSASQSGYHFLIRDTANSVTSIEKKLQIVSDKNGNLSINNVDFVDIAKEHKFKRDVLKNRIIYLGVDTPTEEDTKIFFIKRLNKLLKNLSIRYPKEQERVWELFHNREYRRAAKSIYDGVYENLYTRVIGKLDKDKEFISISDLSNLLFVIDTLNGTNNLERMLLYCMSQSREALEKLMLKEVLSDEESFFLLGKITGMAVRNSRNKDSVIKSILKKSRSADIIAEINKRFEVDYDDIEYKYLLEKWMSKVMESGNVLSAGQSMKSNEKFVFITGMLSEAKTKKKAEVQEGNKNE
ncbi:hypothetical protein [Priestia aryabhattai]